MVQKIEIRACSSLYRSELGFTGVEALITWRFNGTPVTIVEERHAAAVGHRMVADLLEASGPTERWNVSTEVTGSYRDITMVKIAIELADGNAAEMERAKALLTQITNAVRT